MIDLLILLASLVLFSGALGLIAFQDPYQRFHAAGKVSFFGLALLLIADFLKGLTEETPVSLFMIILAPLLVIIISPVFSHVLARSLYLSRKK